MSTTVTAAELRRRVRAVEALQAKTRETAASRVLATRDAATKAAEAKDKAEVEAREAAAAALRLYDNDAELLAGLLDVPAEELEREAKPVTAARAKEVIEDLRRHAARPRIRRSPASRMNPSPSSTGAPPTDSTPPTRPAPDGSRANAV